LIGPKALGWVADIPGCSGSTTSARFSLTRVPNLVWAFGGDVIEIGAYPEDPQQ
jgi:hypothetical protein